MSMNFNRLSTDDKILIMEGAQVLGDVVAGEGTAFWYNSVCRGEMQSVRIGKRFELTVDGEATEDVLAQARDEEMVEFTSVAGLPARAVTRRGGSGCRWARQRAARAVAGGCPRRPTPG